MAKLLSKKEQSSTREISKYTQTKPPVDALLTPSSLLHFGLLIVCAIRVQASSALQAVSQPPSELRQALRESFFVRPPPIFAA
jgi:hypothetical protein